MSGNRLTAAIYWIAIGTFLAGAVVLIVGATRDLEPLRIPGEIVVVAAWPLAALGAVIDVARHRRQTQPD